MALSSGILFGCNAKSQARYVSHNPLPVISIGGIDPDISSMSYVSFDRAIHLVIRAESAALMAKTDIEAFQLLLMHPDSFLFTWLHMGRS